MTGPDRPTREQVADAPAFADDHDTVVASILAAEVRALRAELAAHQRVIAEYVNHVEDGDKFGALVDLVPGLVSDDGQYGAVDPNPGPPVIGRFHFVDGAALDGCECTPNAICSLHLGPGEWPYGCHRGTGESVAARTPQPADAVAAALITAGFDPPPYVGEQWADGLTAGLPEGHREIVTITSLGNTVSGWQARVVRRQVDADGRTVESGCGRGIIRVEHLFHSDAIFQYERLAPLPAVPDGEGLAIAHRARHLDRYYGLWALDDKPWDEMSHEEAYKRGQVFATRYIARHDMSPADEDGEDVPARLEAAAEALERNGSHGLAYELSSVAGQLRDGDGGSRLLRAALAAALARPTQVTE